MSYLPDNNVSLSFMDKDNKEHPASQAQNGLVVNAAEQSGQTYQLLIVDDDDVVREGLVGYLENYHDAPSYSLLVHSAQNPINARQLLEQNSYDLVISDINMPEEDGFSFLQFIRKTYPQTKTALITAYKVEDYIRNARKTGVYNVIAKTAPFNFDELSSVVNNLLRPDEAVGLERYLLPSAGLQHMEIQCSDDIMQVFSALETFLSGLNVNHAPDLLTAVIEAITNAIYHVAKKPDGSLKYEKGQHIAQLANDEYVRVDYGVDRDKIGIAIVDQGGRITADEIVYWLERNLGGHNLLDTHGRGVYLIHALADRLLVNIYPGKKTEIIMLSYFSKDYRANKPIYINQLG
ncbi:MAG: response regulator [Vampirovibrionales bacterium]|nr:response regulator [Vampirovibrionales bacterium]